MSAFLFPLIILAGLFGCARMPAPVVTQETALAGVSSRDMPVLADDGELQGLAESVRQSLEYYRKLPPGMVFTVGPEKATAACMIETLRDFLLIIEDESLSFERKLSLIQKDFILYRSIGSDGRGRVLFTGYYEPILSCRTAADEVFRFPLYRRPDDIIEVDLTLFGGNFPRNRIFGRLSGNAVVPYFSREEIDGQDMLAGRDLELLWCSDLVDIFVLQIQGSGKADLGDGTILSVLYDGQNGRPYESIGKYLIERGAVSRENMSLQAIRDYLSSHSDERDEILYRNPSYVFFRLDMGPSVGNIGAPLTPGRSIATDSTLFPKGALGFISFRKPEIENGVIREWKPAARFVLNQDTGGAIKGPGRVDVFFGHGPEAEATAGHLRHEGELYFLLRRKE